MAPSGGQVLVAYGVVGQGDSRIPAVAVLYDLETGTTTPLLKDCSYSASQFAWSPSGDKIAYPMHANRPEIRVYDLRSGETQVVLRLDSFERLSGLTWSPDGKYLAFAQGDGRGQARVIWAITADGTARQRLAEGLLLNWSPDGRHILYAEQDDGGRLEWHLLEVDAVAAAAGAGR